MTPRELAFREHEDEQLRNWAALPPLERLRWLAQAKEFSRRWLGAAAAQAAPSPPGQLVKTVKEGSD